MDLLDHINPFKALTTFLLIGTEALTFLLSSILVPNTRPANGKVLKRK